MLPGLAGDCLKFSRIGTSGQGSAFEQDAGNDSCGALIFRGMKLEANREHSRLGVATAPSRFAVLLS